MIIYGNGMIDERHTVDTINSISFADAIQINEDGSYDRVTYMEDRYDTWSNEVIIDATDEEKEIYRRKTRKFKIGDIVIISRGRKMKGEQKQIKRMFTFRPNGTFGHNDVEYLVFEDGTKVNRLHCDFV